MTFIIAISESDSRKSCKHSSNSIKRVTSQFDDFFSYPHTYLLKKLVSKTALENTKKNEIPHNTSKKKFVKLRRNISLWPLPSFGLRRSLTNFFLPAYLLTWCLLTTESSKFPKTRRKCKQTIQVICIQKKQQYSFYIP